MGLLAWYRRRFVRRPLNLERVIAELVSLNIVVENAATTGTSPLMVTEEEEARIIGILAGQVRTGGVGRIDHASFRAHQ